MNVLEAMKGFVVYHCLYVGVKTGIFSYIKNANNKGVIVAEVSSDLGLCLDYVQIWFNTAFAFGILDCANGDYSVKSDLQPFLLDENDVRYQGELISLFVDHLSIDIKKQPSHMKSGQTFKFSDHSFEFVELISKRGYLRAKTFVMNFLKKNPTVEHIFNSETLIVDVGCGSGSFLQGVKSFYPNPSYVGIDEDSKSINIATTTKDNKTTFVHGRIEDAELTGEIDCLIMVLTLHEICDSNRLDVLYKCFNCLKPGGYLLIMEFPYPDDPSEFSDSRYLMGTLDQYFEMVWGTKHIGWSDQESIIEKAGYKNINRTFLDDGTYMVISARKPLEEE